MVQVYNISNQQELKRLADKLETSIFDMEVKFLHKTYFYCN